MTDEKELKDQRVPIMMSASELESIDDWMFRNRIRSRGEAIRRLCQSGLAADEHFFALVDHYMAISSAVMEYAVTAKADGDAMRVLALMHDFGQNFGKLRAAVLTMRQNETLEAAMAEMDEIAAAYKAEDPDRALDLMRAYLSSSRSRA